MLIYEFFVPLYQFLYNELLLDCEWLCFILPFSEWVKSLILEKEI